MPWKASSVMEERLCFVARLLDGEAKVIADQRKEVASLRAELDELRGEIRREPADLPVLKLIGGRRG